jgi:hypothetical protein
MYIELSREDMRDIKAGLRYGWALQLRTEDRDRLANLAARITEAESHLRMPTKLPRWIREQGF